MAEYSGAVDVIRKTFRLDEGLALSFSFLLKAGFECEIVQRSKIYTLRAAVHKYRLGVCKMKNSKIPKLCHGI